MGPRETPSPENLSKVGIRGRGTTMSSFVEFGDVKRLVRGQTVPFGAPRVGGWRWLIGMTVPLYVHL